MPSAADLYHSVINDVITNVRDSFMDESVDENVLQELKQLWTTKLDQSKTIEPPPRSQESLLDAKMAASATALGGRGGPAAPPVNQRMPAGVAGARRAGGAAGGGAAAGGPGGGQSVGSQQLVITDPSRLVPVQITIPAQPNNPSSQPRALTVQVPAHALQQSSSTSALLQTVLTQAITQALALPESHAAVFLQSQINNAFKLG